MKFIVSELGTYVVSKVIEAKDKDEAKNLYIKDPCPSDEYEYLFDNFDIGEVKDDEETDDLPFPLLP